MKPAPTRLGVLYQPIVVWERADEGACVVEEALGDEPAVGREEVGRHPAHLARDVGEGSGAGGAPVFGAVLALQGDHHVAESVEGGENGGAAHKLGFLSVDFRQRADERALYCPGLFVACADAQMA